MRKKWHLRDADLSDITAQKARDLIVECFVEAQHETFARTRERLGVSADDATVRRNVLTAVRLAFKACGSDYDRPTADCLAVVVDALARKAEAFGTPADVIAHHRGEVQRILQALALRAGQ